MNTITIKKEKTVSKTVTINLPAFFKTGSSFYKVTSEKQMVQVLLSHNHCTFWNECSESEIKPVVEKGIEITEDEWLDAVNTFSVKADCLVEMHLLNKTSSPTFGSGEFDSESVFRQHQ
ncbi:MAG TPA: hypothetical protein VJY62_02605 [Bacteroidia bacterium]|nr:hypothetical protein [Bacteroidia bacterium]